MSKTISSIKLPNDEVYQIVDATAIHSAEDLGLGSALKFKGVLESQSELAKLTEKDVGDVYLISDTNSEYVYVEVTDEDGELTYSWERLGSVHDAASSTHTHNVSVTGQNSASTISGTVTIPNVQTETKYMSASADAPGASVDTEQVLGSGTSFDSQVTLNKTKIKATVSGGAVGADGTVNAITGFGKHVTDTALGKSTSFAIKGGEIVTKKMVTATIKNPSVSSVSIPTVEVKDKAVASLTSSGSKTDGTAAQWSASVDDNGVLTFSWTANTPTAVTLPTFDNLDMDEVVVAGTPIEASLVTTSEVTVATGSLTTTTTGNNLGDSVATGLTSIGIDVTPSDVEAITSLGDPSTSSVLTGVKVTQQPSVTISSGETGDVEVATGVASATVSANTDNLVDAVVDVVVGAPDISLSAETTSESGRAPISIVQVNGTSTVPISGTAAAQEWTGSGSTGAPQ